MSQVFSKLSSHPSEEVNAATRIMAEASFWQYEGVSTNKEKNYLAPHHIRWYWEQMCEDFPEDYDQEWFGIMMVKAAEASVDWYYVCDYVCDRCPQWSDDSKDK